MRAAVIHEHGGLDVVHVEHVEEPKPGPGEVLVKVSCAGLNHLDIWVRKGRSGTQLKMPHVLGSDGVGVAAAVGENVQSPRVGEQVVIYPGLTCGTCEFCLRGEDSLCASFGLLGLNQPGTFAEYVVVPARNCRPRPAHMTDEEAGGFTLTYVTAWRMLVTRAQVRPGESVLIHGIGGGVAASALQLARLIGAEIFVTSSSNEKLSRAKVLGANHTLNYEKSSVVEWVRQHKGERGVDVVIDAVGAATWPLDLACVRKGGRIVLCGVTTGSQAETNLRTLYWNQLNVFGSTLGSMEDFRQVLNAANVNKLRPVTDEVFPLDRAHDAMEKMEAGRQFGKIALRIAG